MGREYKELWMTLKQIIQSSTPEKCLSRLLFQSSSPSISVPFWRRVKKEGRMKEEREDKEKK